MGPIISPRELAAAIGVSESSLKRWADDGQIKVSRTAGGHRRIAIGEAIRFVRSIRAPLVRPELLGMRDLLAGGDLVLSSETPAERLFMFLREGMAPEARGLILSLYLSGQSVAEIADGPIRSAMGKLGELWKHDPEGVFLEHRATDICIQAVEQLRHLVEPQNPGPVALGGAAPGDPYLLPSLLVGTALAAEGWQAVNLGPNVPFEAILRAIERHHPRVVWLSVSFVRDVNEIEQGLSQLAHKLVEHGRGASGERGPAPRRTQAPLSKTAASAMPDASCHRLIDLAVGGQGLSVVNVPAAPGVHQIGSIAALINLAGNLRRQPDDAMDKEESR